MNYLARVVLVLPLADQQIVAMLFQRQHSTFFLNRWVGDLVWE
jgi:hypothetical protein